MSEELKNKLKLKLQESHGRKLDDEEADIEESDQDTPDNDLEDVEGVSSEEVEKAVTSDLEDDDGVPVDEDILEDDDGVRVEEDVKDTDIDTDTEVEDSESEDVEDVEDEDSEDVEARVEVEDSEDVEADLDEEFLKGREDYLSEVYDEDGINVDNLNLSGDFCDSNGNPIEKVKSGKMGISNINLNDIHIPPRGKIFDLDVSSIEESIHMWGLIEPLHVIPYKNEEGDIKYILVHGYRRYLACSALGMSEVPCLVNSTRPKEVVRYLEVISNNVKKYNFVEVMEIGKYIEERQKGFSHETIENILGLPSGLYLKSKYINSAKNEFPEVFDKVVNEKMTIDSAFRKIEKDIEKGNEVQAPVDANAADVPGGEESYDEINEDVNVQKKGERKPLEPGLRKAVERRDNYSCQSCGMGNNDPALSAVFHAHHIVPVKHQGGDTEENLIMLCPNCHSFVHSIEEGRFRPKKDMLEVNKNISNIVILSNIIIIGLPEDYGKDAYKFYMEKYNKYWDD